MRNTGNGFALLGRGRRHHGAGGNKQPVPPFSAFHIAENQRTKDRRRTPATASPGMNVLSLAIVDQQPAIQVLLTEPLTVTRHQRLE